MKRTTLLCLVCVALIGCAGGGGEPYETQPAAEPEKALITVQAPPPLEVPAPVEVKSDTDWEAKAHNKNIEIVQVLNIINPVAAYITEGFKLHGPKFSPTLHEEWTDTQEHLGKALTLYDSCKKRMAAGEYDKQLFLDEEEVWQLLVKTGVAGVRTKSMVDSELKKAIG